MSETMTAPAAAAPAAARSAVALRRSWSAPVALGVLSLVGLLVLGLPLAGDLTSGFPLSEPNDPIQLAVLSLPSRDVVIGLSSVVLATAGYLAWATATRRPAHPVIGGVAGALLVFAFLVWAVAGASLPLVNLLSGSLALAVPLVFGAMSGVLCERAGVINIAIEGQLLAGAFAAAVIASLTGNLYVGLLGAMAAGLLVSWLLAVFAIRFVVDQIVLGVVLNVLVIGVTNFLYGQVLARNADTWNSAGRLQDVRIPLLADVPILGPVLFEQTIVVYCMYVVVAGLSFALFRTRWGLRVRAVGEHPKAADTAGINVNRIRFRNVLMAGVVAGFGGAFFSLVLVGSFTEEMSAGQGFIALAALIFGRWSPLGALAAALLFGFASNLQNNLSIINTPIPGEFLLMAPYVVTIFAVAGLVGKVRAPAADGVAYRP